MDAASWGSYLANYATDQLYARNQAKLSDLIEQIYDAALEPPCGTMLSSASTISSGGTLGGIFSRIRAANPG